MATIQFRRGTTAQWLAADAAGRRLAPGEPGLDTTTDVVKVGDGVTTWAGLSSVASFTGHDAYYFPAAVLPSGTAAFTPNNTAANFGAYWLFDETVPEIVNFEWYPASEWTHYVMRMGFIAAGAGGGNAVWRAEIFELPVGSGNPATAKTAQANVTLAGPAALGSGWTYGDLVGSVAVPKAIDRSTAFSGAVQLVTIRRVAGDAADTMSGDAGLTIVTVTRLPAP